MSDEAGRTRRWLMNANAPLRSNRVPMGRGCHVHALDHALDHAPSLPRTAMPFKGFQFHLLTPVSDMPALVEAVMPRTGGAGVDAFLQSLPGRRELKDLPILDN